MCANKLNLKPLSLLVYFNHWTTTPWTDDSLNFIESLPKSQGFEVILVVVDRLTNMPISLLFLTYILLLRLLHYICTMFLNYMGCL